MWLRTLAAGLVSVLAALELCAGRADEQVRTQAPDRWCREPAEAEWLIVDETVARLAASGPVYAVCFHGRRPRPLRTAALVLPPGHPWRRTGGILIVHGELAPNGRFGRAQILHGSETLTVKAAVVACLRRWRFAPAMLHGKPVAVHFTATLEIPRS
ncbi:MAG: energy transducer TonB [Thermoanaerobaculia bacterium]